MPNKTYLDFLANWNSKNPAVITCWSSPDALYDQLSLKGNDLYKLVKSKGHINSLCTGRLVDLSLLKFHHPDLARTKRDVSFELTLYCYKDLNNEIAKNSAREKILGATLTSHKAQYWNVHMKKKPPLTEKEEFFIYYLAISSEALNYRYVEMLKEGLQKCKYNGMVFDLTYFDVKNAKFVYPEAITYAV